EVGRDGRGDLGRARGQRRGLQDLGGIELAFAVFDVGIDDGQRIGTGALVAAEARTGDDDRALAGLGRVGRSAARRRGRGFAGIGQRVRLGGRVDARLALPF